MDRRHILRFSAVAAALMLLPGTGIAQQKSIKDQLVGAWSLLIVDGVKADGTRMPIYGPNPIGSLIFTPNGRYSLQLMRTIARPPFASNNRDTGTAEENKATAQGTLSYFGSYTVDEAGKSFTQKIEGSSFPNSEGRSAKLQVTAITDEVLTFSLPGSASSVPGAGYTTLEAMWKKAK